MPYGEETQKRLLSSSLMSQLGEGPGLDIGFRGAGKDVRPYKGAIGVDFDYPGYNGELLPFPTGCMNFVLASHVLEHIPTNNVMLVIQEWFRVLKIGGKLLIAVPHQHLYEKRWKLPSRYNNDHRRFYTPAKLLAEIELALRPNTYRIRALHDNDYQYDYSIDPTRHAAGCYEIVVLIEKIQKPTWELEW